MKYYPIVDTCTASVYPRRPLIDGTGILVPVIDLVLLLTMLIGLLRHASKNSTGIWKLLYQQVTQPVFTVLYQVLSSF